jgi:branched-chain amino acid transport system substrate-binding protein
MKRTRLFAIVMAAGSLLVAACGSSNNSSSETTAAGAGAATTAAGATTSAGGSAETTAAGSSATTASGAATTAASGPAEKIKLGFLASQSGAVAVIGAVSIPAMNLAVKKINDAGGITVGGKRYEFELSIKDDKSDASAAAAAATGLVEDEGVKFLFGPTTSDTSVGVAQLVLPKGVLMFSPGTALQSMLTPDKLTGDSLTLFRTNWSPQGIGTQNAKALRKAFPDAKTIAYIFSDSGSSKATEPVTRDAAVKEGFTTVAEETVPAASTDFQTVLTKVKGSNPDVIMVGSETAVITGMLKQAVDLGIKSNFAYQNQPVSIALKGAIGKPLPNKTVVIGQPSVLETAPNGTLLAAPPSLSDFASDLKTEMGKDVAPGQGLSMYYYDFPALLAEAMQKAGTVTDTKAIANALAGGASIKGALGDVAFTPQHVTNSAGGFCVMEANSDTPTCDVTTPPGV